MRRHTLFAAALMSAALVFMPPSGQAQSPEDLNDLEIAHVAYSAGALDIRYAHLALAISENPKIREFAALMLRDHGAVNDAAVALITRLNVTPKDNEVSQSLVAQAAGIRSRLRAAEGAEFDRIYAENELSYHQFVNGALAGIFIPNAQNAELKALLEDALATFKAHEHHAEAMVEAVSMAGE